MVGWWCDTFIPSQKGHMMIPLGCYINFCELRFLIGDEDPITSPTTYNTIVPIRIGVKRPEGMLLIVIVLKAIHYFFKWPNSHA